MGLLPLGAGILGDCPEKYASTGSEAGCLVLVILPSISTAESGTTCGRCATSQRGLCEDLGAR